MARGSTSCPTGCSTASSSPWGALEPEPFFDSTRVYQLAPQNGVRSHFCDVMKRASTAAQRRPGRSTHGAAPGT